MQDLLIAVGLPLLVPPSLAMLVGFLLAGLTRKDWLGLIAGSLVVPLLWVIFLVAVNKWYLCPPICEDEAIFFNNIFGTLVAVLDEALAMAALLIIFWVKWRRGRDRPVAHP